MRLSSSPSFPCTGTFFLVGFTLRVHFRCANNIGLVLRYSFIAVSAVLYASFLGPAFYYLWIYAGSGNANFFYAITLVYALGLTIVVHDLIFAIIRDEVEVERPELKGKDISQI